MNKEEIEKAKETMQHWVMYEKENKDKINKADELIKIQETLLQYIDQLEEVKGMKEAIELAGLDIKSILRFRYDNERLKDKINQLEQENNKQNKIIDEMANLLGGLELSKDEEGYEIMEKEDWKQYFEKKVEEE